MVMIDVGNPKMAREVLCAVQTQINLTQMPSAEHHSLMIENMIDQIDMHRPLGPDGKHGDRHTDTCGCEDKTVGVRTVYITGHENREVETTVWTDDHVTYRHRVKTRDRWDSGLRWGEWVNGKGE